MDFPPGRPLLVLILIALISGAAVMLRPGAGVKWRTVWTFNRDHAAVYRAAAPDADVRLMSGRALDVALQSALASGAGGPDVVEIEISTVGRYLRPPVAQIGLLPVDDFLDQSGWRSRLLPARLAAWSKAGHAFGVPLDVHPVALAYRADLFAEAGIAIDSAVTWREFQTLCLAYQRRLRARGSAGWALELSATSADVPYMIMLQRGVELFDAQGRVTLTDSRIAATLAFYATLVAGPGRIADGAGGDPQTLARDLSSGGLAVVVLPDWRVVDLKAAAPALAGAFRVRALPRFDPADAPTSTWGGTMLAIPRAAPDAAASWRLIENIALTDAARLARFNVTHVSPPLVDSTVRRPTPDAFFGGQDVDQLFASLAPVVPARRVTPFTSLAIARLSLVLADAVDLARADATAPEIARALVPALGRAQTDIERVIRFATPR